MFGGRGCLSLITGWHGNESCVPKFSFRCMSGQGLRFGRTCLVVGDGDVGHTHPNATCLVVMVT